MPDQVNWDEAYEVGVLLSQAHPDKNPLEVALADLRMYVSSLAQFRHDPAALTEAKLKAFQAAWHEEFLDRTQG